MLVSEIYLSVVLFTTLKKKIFCSLISICLLFSTNNLLVRVLFFFYNKIIFYFDLSSVCLFFMIFYHFLPAQCTHSFL